MKKYDSSKLLFLGTGTSQGVPMIGCDCEVCKSSEEKDHRLRSSVLVSHRGYSILIDAGPDFRQQLLRANITDLDAILLTHEHKDHTGGLDDVRAINYIHRKAMPIYCENRVLQSLKKEYSYVFSENQYPGMPQFDLKIIDEHPFSIISNKCCQPLEIIPIRAKHFILPILGYRIGNMAYITDANAIPDEEFKKLSGLSIFVINTVRREKHISHFSLSEAIAVAQRVGAKRSFLTHLSHQIGKHKELSEELPSGIEPAYDGLELTY